MAEELSVKHWKYVSFIKTINYLIMIVCIYEFMCSMYIFVIREYLFLYAFMFQLCVYIYLFVCVCCCANYSFEAIGIYC